MPTKVLPQFTFLVDVDGLMLIGATWDCKKLRQKLHALLKRK